MVRITWFLAVLFLALAPQAAFASDLIGTWRDTAGFEATVSVKANGEYVLILNGNHNVVIDEGPIDGSGNVSSQRGLIQTLLLEQDGTLTVFFVEGETAWSRNFHRDQR